MRAEIIPIGNSKGIRLPHSILKECGFKNAVDIEVVDHQLIVKAVHQPRAGWNEAFAATPSQENDVQDIQNVINEWDESEWEW